MKNINFGKNFNEAVKDYFYLLQRGYPPRGFLMLVGNRYGLSDTLRSILYRGIAPERKNIMRRQKLIMPDEISNKVLHIDGFNVLMTVASYISGKPVFISTDGFLRDASALRGKMRYERKTDEALLLMMKYLLLFKNIKYLHLDEKVDFHSKIIDRVVEIFEPKKETDKIKVIVSPSVDNDLIHIKEGIVATSDSEIIDNTKLELFDLARHLIEWRFHPDFYIISPPGT